MYSCLWETIAKLRSVIRHMGSHTVVCWPTRVNAPYLNLSQTNWYSIYLAWRDERLNTERTQNLLVSWRSVSWVTGKNDCLYTVRKFKQSKSVIFWGRITFENSDWRKIWSKRTKESALEWGLIASCQTKTWRSATTDQNSKKLNIRLRIEAEKNKTKTKQKKS